MPVVSPIRRYHKDSPAATPTTVSRRLLLAAILLALVTLAACGRGRQQEPTPYPTSTPIAAAPAAATPVATTVAAAKPASAATEPPAAQEPAAAAAEPAAQPGSPLAPQSPLAPSSPMPTPTSIAEALGLKISATTGAMTGVLFTKVTGADQPVAKLQIGLAEVIRDEQGNPKVGGYEASSSPRVETDARGRFSFSDVKPGVYTLIADYVSAQIQLQVNGDGDTILVEVKPNEVADLGEMHFPKLPVPIP